MAYLVSRLVALMNGLTQGFIGKVLVTTSKIGLRPPKPLQHGVIMDVG